MLTKALKINMLLFNGRLNNRSAYTFSDDNDQNSLGPEITKENAQKLIDKWVKENQVVLFMKGTPLAPRCGYSNFVVELLKKYGNSLIMKV